MTKSTCRRGFTWLGVLVMVLAGAAVSTAGAEVSAEVDRDGRYVRTFVDSRVSVNRIDVWNVVWPQARRVPLNVLGDLNRDLWPSIAEDPLSGKPPWVVWSRYNRGNYDLAWSRWQDRKWEEVRWLQDPASSGDDLDPDITLDEGGRPFLAWWTDDNGLGKIYFSMFLDTRWMRGYVVSDLLVDSRYPTIEANGDGSFTIEFETPEGIAKRTVVLNEGVSINDDADPVGTVTVTRFGR